MPPEDLDPAPRLRGFNAWTAVASLGAGLVVSGWILSRSGGSFAAIASVPWPTHVLAVAMVALEVIARGVRMTSIARGIGQPLRLRTAVEAQLAGDALAAATPFRAGSDPAKIALLHRSGVRMGTSGALLLGEMCAEALTLIACAAVIALVAPTDRWVALGLVGYAAIASAAGAAALLVFRTPTEAPPRLWSRLHLSDARWGHVRHAVSDFRGHAKRLRRLPVRWSLAAAGATVAHIGARLSILPILVVGLGASAPDGLVLRPFFVLYSTALLPAPGGGGGVEVTFAALLGGTLGTAGLAATVLWWRLYTFYLSAAAGGVFICLRTGGNRHGYRSNPEASPSLSQIHRREVTWPQQLVGMHETTTTAKGASGGTS